MKFLLYAPIIAAVAFLHCGCATEHPAREAARDVENKFEEGATGHGKLVEPDPSLSPVDQ